MTTLCFARGRASGANRSILHNAMTQSICNLIFCLTAGARSLFESKGGTSRFCNGLPLRESVRKLRDLGLCRDNNSARSTMTSLGLAGGRAGRIDPLVNHGSVNKCVLGIVLNLTARTSSLLESEGCAGGLRNGLPIGKAVLVRQATRGCTQKSEERHQNSH